MIPRDELEETFSPALRGRDLLFALAVILTLAAMAVAAVFFALRLTTPKSEAIATTSPSASPSASISTNTAPAFMATPVAMKVCTNIPDGRLHVRFAAGDGSEVRGYLAEGEPVLPASETDTTQGEVWLQITSPITGWVNARYLCPSE